MITCRSLFIMPYFVFIKKKGQCKGHQYSPKTELSSDADIIVSVTDTELGFCNQETSKIATYFYSLSFYTSFLCSLCIS